MLIQVIINYSWHFIPDGIHSHDGMTVDTSAVLLNALRQPKEFIVTILYVFISRCLRPNPRPPTLETVAIPLIFRGALTVWNGNPDLFGKIY